jgi:hypothetical protein
MLHSICHGFIMNRPFDDHSSISDTESSVPRAAGAGAGAAAGEEEGPETTATQGEELCQCQQVYEGSGNEKKVLYLMCIGLNHNGLPLFSFENEPWSQLPKTSLVRPKNTDYGKEVSRRAILYSTCPAPCPTNWNRAQSMEWLQQNPVVDAKCIEFLTNEVSRLRVVLERAQQQQAAAASVSTTTSHAGGASGQNWQGSVPYL